MSPDTETGEPGSSTGATVARAIAIGALVLAVVLVGVLLLGGSDATTYKMRFANAGQLVKGDDVQVGGRRIGSIDKIDLTDNNQAQITVSVQKPYAPLHEGTVATIRASSLSGIANRYIALTLGPNNAQKLSSGALLRAEKNTAPVDLDQLFNTLDAKTRRGLQNVVKGFATQYAGQESAANRSAKYFNTTISTTSRVVGELLRDQPAFVDFLTRTKGLVTTLASRRPQLAALIGNANATVGAIGDENASLDRSLAVLPTTLRRANTTFVNLRGTLGDLDTLVNASKPATRRLAPLLRELRPLVASARPTIADLRRLVGTPGSNNDLTDAVLKLPRLQRVASPTFKSTVIALQKSLPFLQFIRPYTPELEGWFRDFGQGASNYDANGHFARIQPSVGLFGFDNQTLAPVPNGGGLGAISTHNFRRCPGGATQPAADGSAPYLDKANYDCARSQHP